jgi:hypothetical protein
MIPQYNRKSLVLGVPGLLLQVAGVALPNFYVAYARANHIAIPIWIPGLSEWIIIAGDILLIAGLCY